MLAFFLCVRIACQFKITYHKASFLVFQLLLSVKEIISIIIVFLIKKVFWERIAAE